RSAPDKKMAARIRWAADKTVWVLRQPVLELVWITTAGIEWADVSLTSRSVAITWLIDATDSNAAIAITIILSRYFDMPTCLTLNLMLITQKAFHETKSINFRRLVRRRSATCFKL
ncbi:MAG: hypothetical protein VW547_16905, partial [Alphaproteobacteria bacterium]